MDPKIIKKTPPYLVLAYQIEWQDIPGREEKPLDYRLLDFRAYQRPDQLSEDEMRKVAAQLLHDEVYPQALGFKLKVVEA